MQQQWKTWRERQQVDLPQFLDWLDRYTDAEHDPDNLFAYWRQLPGHNDMLARTVAGNILPIGNGPQLLLAVFYALFQIANGRNCYVATAMTTDVVYLKMVLQKLSELGKLRIRILGTQLGFQRFTLRESQDADLAVVDYFQLMVASHTEPEQFAKQVQSLFIIELDLALYATRLILLDHGKARAAGMVYRSEGQIRNETEDQKGHIDAAAELDAMDQLRLAGSTSWVDSFTVRELTGLMPRKLKGRLAARTAPGYTALNYRTSLDRASALVSDVIRTPGNALVVCCADDVRHEIAEELRKSGQDATLTSLTTDVITFFTHSSALEGKKRVCLLKGLPSTITAPELKRLPGALFLAEHFLTPGMHQKIFAFAEQIFTQTHEPRLYFALEDQLFTIYAEKGGFERLFNLIDFTEKYDPWKQIRRVLAKSMIRKLHRLRATALDDQAPMVTTVLDMTSKAQTKKERKVTSKLDAPCFCGSGKPFRECHGKLKK